MAAVTSTTTTVPGNAYPAKTITHRYSDAQVTVSPPVEVTYTARFRVAGGAFAVAAGIGDRGAEQSWLYILLGLTSLVLGIVVLLYPFVAAVSLVWTIGAWLIAAGILQIATGVRRRGRLWLVLLGALDVLLGGLLLIMDPISAIFFLAVALGLTFALHGATMLALALRMRRN